MSGPALSRRERLILRDIERDLLDDEDFVLRMSDLLLDGPPADEPPAREPPAREPPADEPPPPVGTLPDRALPDRPPPPAGHPRERPPRRARPGRTRPPGASPHGDEPLRRTRRTGFRAAVREHGLVVLVPVCAALAAVVFGGAPVYVSAVFAAALMATVAVGVGRYYRRRRRRSS
ncbi:hypothetical protein OG216_43495 [Streptomycetaceae bacterium NBC_01309]